MKKIVSILLFGIIVLLPMESMKTSAAAKNITRRKFIEMVVLELALKTDKSADNAFIGAALREGIITQSTFSGEYDTALTRSDAAEVLVRADEYLNGITVSEDIVQMVIEERISDIHKAYASKRPFVAKSYYLGYIVGSSNGEDSMERRFNPSGEVSMNTAKLLVSRIKNIEKREKIASDGQVVQAAALLPETTNISNKKSITRRKFIEMVVLELALKTDKSADNAFISAALREGIIMQSTFSGEYDTVLTRSDAAEILVRADEYLNGVTVTDDIVQMVIEERISDILEAHASKRPFIARSYYLGYIVGSSNGEYSTNRRFNPSGEVSMKTAELLVSRIKNTEKREPITPDGQLIRTTNLPSNADMYPYILASYPNAYYDWEFQFMKILQGTPVYGTDRLVNLEDYAAPADIAEFQEGESYQKDLACINEWEEKAWKHIEAVFNVDYRTIREDEEWFRTLVETDESYGILNQKNVEKRLNQYIELMTENKVIIEADKVAFDMSTLYVDGGTRYIRIYVHYRINSALKTEQMEAINEWGSSSLIYSHHGYPDLNDVRLGEWRDGYFDIEVGRNGSAGIRGVVVSDYLHDVNVIRK